MLRWDQHDQLHATARQTGSARRPGDHVLRLRRGRPARAQGNRTAQATGTRKSERIYVGAFEVYREYAPDGTVTLERETLHVFDDTRRVALVETRTAGTDRGPAELIRYQLANHLGSSVLELDESAQVISYEEYYPYGSTSYQAVRSRTETPKRYRYTGKERDTETGLYYHGARYYAPWLARWTSCDPSGPRDDLNLYNYVSGNPVTAVDRTGLDSDNVVDQSDPNGGTLQDAGVPDQTPPPADAAPPAGAPPPTEAPPSPPADAALPPDSPPADQTAGMPTANVAPPEVEVQRKKVLHFDLPPDSPAFADDMLTSPFSYLTYSLIYNIKHHMLALVEPRMMLNSSGQMVPSPVKDKSAELAAVVGDIAPLVFPEVLPETSLPVVTGEESLVSQTLEQASHLMGRSDSMIEKGNQVLAGVEYGPTGLRRFGRGTEDVAGDLHPALRQEYEPWRGLVKGDTNYARLGPPGAHAEINALNRALWELDPTGTALTAEDLRSFNMVSVWLGKGGPYVMPRCPTCWFMTPYVNYMGPVGPRRPF